MNDKRTVEQRYADWVLAVNKCHEKGWRHLDGWIFCSPDGAPHDLSAMDLDKLDEIERKAKEDN